jgi:hypothetical protein
MPLFRLMLHSKKSRIHFASAFDDDEHTICGMTGSPGELKITKDEKKINCGNCIAILSKAVILGDLTHPDDVIGMRQLYVEHAGGHTTVWECDASNRMWPLTIEGLRMTSADAVSYDQLVWATDGALARIDELTFLRRLMQSHHAALREENIL